LRDRIQAQEGADRILLHGRRSRADIFAAAARSRVLLMLSRVEPFGMATVEAMGMGCMPVAWDVPGGTREIVRPGEGAFAPLADYGALAQQVLDALDRQRLSFPACAARVRETFGEARMGRAYMALL